MQQNHDKIQAENAQLFAISSDNVNATSQTVNGEGLKFPVLSDKDRDTITDYNVVDPNNTRLARPSTFILKQDGTIAWKFLGNVGDRVPTAEILTELGKL